MEAPNHGTSVDTTSEHARFLAYGTQLIETHADLRDMLADLREGVIPERELGAHCLAFCARVTWHHTGEDETVFPVLAREHPELRDFLAELARDHQVIAGLLTRVTAIAVELAGGPAHGGGPAQGAGPADGAGLARGAGPAYSAGPARGGGPVSGDGPEAGRVAGLRSELDGLAAVLETHFIGEEKRLVAVLNAIDPSVGLTGLGEWPVEFP
jgi:hypothetical protein